MDINSKIDGFLKNNHLANPLEIAAIIQTPDEAVQIILSHYPDAAVCVAAVYQLGQLVREKTEIFYQGLEEACRDHSYQVRIAAYQSVARLREVFPDGWELLLPALEDAESEARKVAFEEIVYFSEVVPLNEFAAVAFFPIQEPTEPDISQSIETTLPHEIRIHSDAGLSRRQSKGHSNQITGYSKCYPIRR